MQSFNIANQSNKDLRNKLAKEEKARRSAEQHGYNVGIAEIEDTLWA